MMRILLVSDHTLASQPQPACQFAKILVQNGMQVHWLADTDTISALAEDPDFRPAAASEMPVTCRHVIPYTLHGLHGIQLVGIESGMWHDTALHTRLFTFLCLLHRERPFSILQAWGGLPTAYLTVYTAAFLGLPGTVFYTPSCLQDGPQQAFLWQWVAQHVAMALTAHASDREQLLDTSSLQPHQVRVIESIQATTGPAVVAWYQALAQNFQDVAKNPFNL